MRQFNRGLTGVMGIFILLCVAVSLHIMVFVPPQQQREV